MTKLVLYLDDVLVFSKGVPEHLERLDLVLERLIENGLKLNGRKCNLFCEQWLYLGPIVSKAGIAVDLDKIKHIVEWPVPQTKEPLRSFSGLASYYRRFVPGFSTVVAPLNLSIGHDSDTAGKPGNKQCSIEWNAKADKAFEQLKQLLTTTPVLVYPDFSKDFVHEVDA